MTTDREQAPEQARSLASRLAEARAAGNEWRQLPLVVATRAAVRRGLAKPGEVGTLAGWSPYTWMIYVMREGKKRPQRFHPSFWRLAP